jgi:hypothetical protein
VVDEVVLLLLLLLLLLLMMVLELPMVLEVEFDE